MCNNGYGKLGLYKALDANKIDYIQTPVGDKYVLKKCRNMIITLVENKVDTLFSMNMKKPEMVCLLLYKFLMIMKDTGKTLQELCDGLFIYPQLLENVQVKDKEHALHDAGLTQAIQEVADQLGDEGRILVRPSGTEPLIRVMVEAKTDELCAKYVGQIVQYMKENNF